MIETKYILSKCYKKNGLDNKANQITKEISNIYSENEKLNIFDLNDLFLTVFFDHLILLNQNPDPSSSEVFKLVKDTFLRIDKRHRVHLENARHVYKLADYQSRQFNQNDILTYRFH